MRIPWREYHTLNHINFTHWCNGFYKYLKKHFTYITKQLHFRSIQTQQHHATELDSYKAQSLAKFPEPSTVWEKYKLKNFIEGILIPCKTYIMTLGRGVSDYFLNSFTATKIYESNDSSVFWFDSPYRYTWIGENVWILVSETPRPCEVPSHIGNCTSKTNFPQRVRE